MRFLGVKAILLVASLGTVLPVPASAEEMAKVDSALRAAIAGSQRTPEFAARDKYRHPLETLEFFGIRPDQTVVEVLPGAGWYTEILAPLLKDQGQLIEATPPTSSQNPHFRKMAMMYESKLAFAPGLYGNVKFTPFEPPEYIPLGPPASADMVVTFRNLHDFVYLNVHDEVSDEILRGFLRSAYEVLKPGGVLGITDHRARAGEPIAESIKMGRLLQDFVIREARLAGFEESRSSEVNANPKDDGTYPVWNLPPMLKLGNEDRAKFLAIGESDEMTLRFTKPSF